MQQANHGKKAGCMARTWGWSPQMDHRETNGLTILPLLVRLKTLDMAKHEKYGISPGQFKAGNHWCQCFMKWNGLSLWPYPTFHPYIINLHKQYSYPLHVTANRQNPLTFDMLPNWPDLYWSQIICLGRVWAENGSSLDNSASRWIIRLDECSMMVHLTRQTLAIACVNRWSVCLPVFIHRWIIRWAAVLCPGPSRTDDLCPV